MKAFIFDRVSGVSDNYHPEGGLVVIANDEDHAKQLVSERPEIEISDENWKHPYLVLELAASVEPQIVVFPDTGCC